MAYGGRAPGTEAASFVPENRPFLTILQSENDAATAQYFPIGTSFFNIVRPPISKLLMIRRCVRKRIVETTAIRFWGVDKSVEIFVDINRIEQQTSVVNLFCVFD